MASAISTFTGIRSSVQAVIHFIFFVFNVFKVTFSHPTHYRFIRDQMFEIGVMSLSLLTISGFCTGSVLAAQTFFNLEESGLSSVTGLVVTKAMLVEVGPVLTAFMIIGRVGSSMCAELGTMRVSEQIDALLSMSIDPIQHLVSPRFIAGIVMLPVLSVYTAFSGIIGAFIVAVFYYSMSHVTFLGPLPDQIEGFDLATSLIKSIIFGITIVTISCYCGLNVKEGATGVGQATTQCVVLCYSLILVGNVFITLSLNSSYEFIKHLLTFT